MGRPSSQALAAIRYSSVSLISPAGQVQVGLVLLAQRPEDRPERWLLPERHQVIGLGAPKARLAGLPAHEGLREQAAHGEPGGLQARRDPSGVLRPAASAG